MGSKSIGRLRGFQGNYGCFVRAYAYICSLGAEGLRDASETAVLNANYLLARLREHGVAEYLPLAYGELCMHEFVLSGGPMKRELGDQDARPRQAPARLRLSPADGVLPAAGRRGADGRADRDRDQGDARRFRRRDRRDPARGRRGPRDRAHAPLTPRRCGVSTRSRAANAAPPSHASAALLSSRCASSPGIQPTGAQAPRQLHRGDPPVRRGQERGEALFCIVDLHATTVAYDPAELRRSLYDLDRAAARRRPRPRALHPVPPERRARAHRADLAAVERHRLRRSAAHAPVQGQVGRAARAGLRRPASSTRC